MSINETLAERRKTHGDFREQATTAQRLKAVMRDTPNWKDMPPPIRESIELICTKLSRAGHGDWKERDHARDCGGYSELWVRELE